MDRRHDSPWSKTAEYFRFQHTLQTQAACMIVCILLATQKQSVGLLRMLKSCQDHTRIPRRNFQCHAICKTPSVEFLLLFSRTLAFLSAVDRGWYMEPDFLVQTSPAFVLFQAPCPPLVPVFNGVEHRGHMFKSLFCYEQNEGHQLVQMRESPWFLTQTSAEQWAGTLVRIKLSAIAAIICKSKTFHCASVPYYRVSRFRLKNLSLGEYYYLTTHFLAQIISIHVGMTTDNRHYSLTHYNCCIKNKCASSCIVLEGAKWQIQPIQVDIRLWLVCCSLVWKVMLINVGVMRICIIKTQQYFSGEWSLQRVAKHSLVPAKVIFVRGSEWKPLM